MLRRVCFERIHHMRKISVWPAGRWEHLKSGVSYTALAFALIHCPDAATAPFARWGVILSA
jgi:hypothetical protein